MNCTMRTWIVKNTVTTCLLCISALKNCIISKMCSLFIRGGKLSKYIGFSGKLFMYYYLSLADPGTLLMLTEMCLDSNFIKNSVRNVKLYWNPFFSFFISTFELVDELVHYRNYWPRQLEKFPFLRSLRTNIIFFPMKKKPEKIHMRYMAMTEEMNRYRTVTWTLVDKPNKKQL